MSARSTPSWRSRLRPRPTSSHLLLHLLCFLLCLEELKQSQLLPTFTAQQTSHQLHIPTSLLLLLLWAFCLTGLLLQITSVKTRDPELVGFNVPINTLVWLGGRVVRMLDLRSTGREFESRPPCCRVQRWASRWHTCASVTNQYNLVPANGPCSWEGNRRSSIALATRHRH